MTMIALSVTAQTKMALHSTKHCFSNPVHGIVLGRDTTEGGETLEVVDVVPVCHEVPTKPIVDMALRLTDAYLRQRQEKGELENVNIVGWYSANADANDGGDVPNPSACRVAAAIAENRSGHDEGGDGGGKCVLLLVSTPKIAQCLRDAPDAVSSTMCAVFEQDKSRTFTQRVDESRVAITTTPSSNIDRSRGVLSEAMKMYVSHRLLREDNASYVKSVDINDFVDHLTDCGEADWIENRSVNELIAKLAG